jgi:hypothetical protein
MPLIVTFFTLLIGTKIKNQIIYLSAGSTLYHSGMNLVVMKLCHEDAREG